MTRVEAVVAGHICLDIIPQIPATDLKSFFAPGSLAEIGPALLATGGSVANTGRNLHRLGIATSLMGKVGDDPFGQIIQRLIREDDPALAEDMIVAPGETSSYTVVISPPRTDRFFMHCAGANHTFGVEDVPYDRLHDVRLFHFGYPPFMRQMYINEGAGLVEMVRRVKETDTITSLDMALPDPSGPSGQVNWPLVLDRALPYVDVFLPSVDELWFMVNGTMLKPGEWSDAMVSDLAQRVLDLGARVVVIKMGDRGLYLRTGPEGAPFLNGDGWRSRELWAPCFRPEPLVGTTGSGDATIAGFLAGVLHGQTVEQAVTTAVAVGGCNVEAADALSGVLSWRATQGRVEAGWPRAALTVDAPGWSYDAASGLWIGPHDGR
jgi:sugar/nucleoside kinase (ribokinase family)